jgi:hypothetical protein
MTQLIIQKDSATRNSNSHDADCFALITIYNKKKHIRGNPVQIVENWGTGALLVKTATMRVVIVITMDRLTDAMTYLALGVGAQQAGQWLSEAAGRVVDDIATQPFAYIICETQKQPDSQSPIKEMNEKAEVEAS